jgi:pimeloyl-ACP methyl ester carboxylesterase
MSFSRHIGLGHMSYLLVPGAGGDPWYWHRLAALLDDAVAVQLPAADPEAGWADYADAIVTACDGRSDITLVAQSMGGFSAPLVCDRIKVRRLVLVNAMIPLPGETFGEWWSNTRQHEAMIGPFDERETFFHDVPGELTAEAFSRPMPDQAEIPEPWPPAAWPDVRTEVVAGADDRLFPPEFQRRVAKERLGLDVAVLPGGHLIALSQPEPLAAYLRTE